MKIKRTRIITVFVILALVLFSAVTIMRVMQDQNKLNVQEKRYITKNKSSLITINVLNNSSIFGNAGTGVYYDFLSDFTKENELNFNIVTNPVGTNATGLSLNVSNNMPSNGKVLYIDHYVLVSKNFNLVTDINKASGTIGSLENVNTSLTKTYENGAALFEALESGEVNYILVPRMEYLNKIMDGLYYISNHVSDMKVYYYMNMSDDVVLNSILSKFANVWIDTKLEESLNKSEYQVFIKNLRLTEKELDAINSKTYTYGYITNAPYDVSSSGLYGGITKVYLDKFAKFANISIDYKHYKNLNKLKAAIDKNKIDIYVNYYGEKNLSELDSLYNLELSVLMNNKDTRVFTNLDSLKGETVYAKENSLVYEYLLNSGIKVNSYKKDKEVKRLIKKNNIVVADYYNALTLNSGTERFRISTLYTYNFVSDNDTMFNRLFTYYMMSLDKKEVVYNGIDNYYNTFKSGKFIYQMIEYAALIILIVGSALFITNKLSKRVRIKKRIKKNDKMKYIDMLTSLKNRNFLNENISRWNQNTIYPQSIIVIDLNGLQDLNDTYGYQEGDKQIKALANALIKTQLDNSEIMRTDGNEFTIYLVGYNEKQVLSYIKKLNKEFKELPHDRGAAIGFSMITDDVKLIDDAINEATERMKENKELQLKEDTDER